MSGKKFNWGILGPGRIAHQFADGLKVIDDASLYAVASSNLERAEAFANEYGGAKTYNSYESLINDPEVDLVWIFFYPALYLIGKLLQTDIAL
jgi:predicted dehydrogenase